MTDTLRNIAIIAHVDHGKTTLVDAMLAQGGAFRENEARQERAMDSNDQERERGITILAKPTSVTWKDTRINIVDTPGHADFGGEVERILSMVDGCVLLVDAAEGPMPQTKFVLGKALALGLRPIVVLNKVDRPNADPDATVDAAFDLFSLLGADEEQLDFPYLYASGKEGWAAAGLEDRRESLAPLFDRILAHVPAPSAVAHRDEPFRMLATLLDYDPFLGRVLTGRVESGQVSVGETVKATNLKGEPIEQARLSKLLAFRGLKRVPVNEAEAGEIIAIAGLSTATVADTLMSLRAEEPVPAPPIDPPTIAVTVTINDSPLAGRDGDKVQSRVIRERLLRQAEGDVAIRVSETADKDAFEVAGRGELQLGVLIETLRREGFELSVSRPQVLTRADADSGQLMEPVEEVVIDVDEEFAGAVIEKLSQRKARVQEMTPSGGGKTRVVLHAPSRGLVGYHAEFMTDTRGAGVMNRLFHAWEPHAGPIPGRTRGALVAQGQGDAVPYALWNLEERGVMFIGAGEPVYEG
ncbi:MAG: translational GTPase TypA, partial [Caulobacterales bacterium]|nr:translational GTPase TypA [Caulobacterales bacterium]